MNYFLGLVICKLFSSKILDAPWLLHLDVFRDDLAPELLKGRSRPDLVGENPMTGEWFSFEAKGRMREPSADIKIKAKSQAARLVSVSGTPCALRIGSISFFEDSALKFYWRDPEPDKEQKIEISEPDNYWSYYYSIATNIVMDLPLTIDDTAPSKLEPILESADVEIDVHDKISNFLAKGNWVAAKSIAVESREEFKKDGYQPDGIRVKAGKSWSELIHPTTE